MADNSITSKQFVAATDAIVESVERVIDGKREAVRAALICLIAEGHLLIEDVPGVGKTMLARALAATLDASVRRIQFTPDLLPSDVTGVSIYNPESKEFTFTPGAIFANFVIADEINRASPKTQSALLEAMEEGQVSVDGVSHALPAPSLVVATQNPLEMEGTYALPEAQRDRFMMRIAMGYPSADAEALMLRQRETHNPLNDITPVLSTKGVQMLIDFARGVHTSPEIEAYAVAIAQATRREPALQLGASPRATLQLVRAAKVAAALEGREYVVPDDIAALVLPVFEHRVIATSGPRGASATPERDALQHVLQTVPVPVGGPPARG